MRRRDFVRASIAAVAAWPIAGRGQQPEQVRRIGILVPGAAAGQISDRLAAFQLGLQELGWTDGRNLRIDYRWGEGDADRIRRSATELVALAPDVIYAVASPAVGPLLEATRTVPIVFAAVVDPVGAGYVDSLARPGANATGFLLFEYGIAGKWLELLKQIAPALARAAVIRDPNASAGIGQWAVIQGVAPSIGVELSLINLRDAGSIEPAIAAVAHSPNSGLIVTAAAPAYQYQKLIIKLAADHKLPAIYFDRTFVTGGGLISYGPDVADLFRRAAGYVDRILKGEKPGDLPVQAPTEYELAINLKTAKALGLILPPALLASADRVIE